MSPRIFVVTGSNKGIGYGIVRNLAKKVDDAVIFLTARNANLGQESVDKLKTELNDKEFGKVRLHQLDITDKASIEKLRDDLKSEFGGFDVLVNNAGIAYKAASTAPDSEQAEVTCNTNYFGLRQACDILFPILRPGARVVNVQSRAGQLGYAKYSDNVKSRLMKADLTVDELDQIVKDFIQSAKAGTQEADGYPKTNYGFSKAAGIALTFIQQRQFDKEGARKIVNAVCPGYVDTDMTSHKGHLSIDQGAESPVWLATLPLDADKPRGEFCAELKPIKWDDKFIFNP